MKATDTSSSLPASQRFSFVYALLNPRSKRRPAIWFKLVVSVVILVDLISFILSTEPSLRDEYHHVFHILEGISSSIFLLEYVARVITCVERQKYKQMGPILGRLRFMLTASALIDALSSTPFFLELLMGFTLPRLTYLKFLRLLRITKTSGAMRATDAVYRVVYYNREILYVCAFVCVLLVLGTGVLLYYLRPVQPDNPQDAENFQSISQTMYLATLMLTGQGGPQGDLPWYTKAVVLLTSIVSVAMFSIPASMLTWGFEAEASRMAQRSYERSRRRAEGMETSDDDYSTDEEYMKIIAEVNEVGSNNGSNGDDSWHKELLERFQQADTDGSGNLTLREFIDISNAVQGASNVAGGAAGSGHVLATIVSRVKQLETEVRDNTKKLDRILDLLESKKKK